MILITEYLPKVFDTLNIYIAFLQVGGIDDSFSYWL